MRALTCRVIDPYFKYRLVLLAFALFIPKAAKQ